MPADPDFYPLIPGLIREYRSRGAAGTGLVRFEVLSVSWKEGKTLARCRRTRSQGGGLETKDFTARREPSGVYSSGQKEFPLPVWLGRRWRSEPVEFEVSELEAVVTVPAGKFEGCLKVFYRIGGGDGGSGERIYAPGIGLVREDCSDEADPFELALTRFVLPGRGDVV